VGGGGSSDGSGLLELLGVTCETSSVEDFIDTGDLEWIERDSISDGGGISLRDSGLMESRRGEEEGGVGGVSGLVGRGV